MRSGLHPLVQQNICVRFMNRINIPLGNIQIPPLLLADQVLGYIGGGLDGDVGTRKLVAGERNDANQGITAGLSVETFGHLPEGRAVRSVPFAGINRFISEEGQSDLCRHNSLLQTSSSKKPQVETPRLDTKVVDSTARSS